MGAESDVQQSQQNQQLNNTTHKRSKVSSAMESFTHRPHLQLAKRVYDSYVRSSSKNNVIQSFGMADQMQRDHSYTMPTTMNTNNQDQGIKWYQTPNPIGQKVQALSLNPQIFCISCKKRMCPCF